MPKNDRVFLCALDRPAYGWMQQHTKETYRGYDCKRINASECKLIIQPAVRQAIGRAAVIGRGRFCLFNFKFSINRIIFI